MLGFSLFLAKINSDGLFSMYVYAGWGIAAAVTNAYAPDKRFADSSLQAITAMLPTWAVALPVRFTSFQPIGICKTLPCICIVYACVRVLGI